MVRPASLLVPAALLAALAAPRTGGAQVRPPRVSSIQVGRDTVRFFARTDHYSQDEMPVFGFVRATRQWIPLSGRVRRQPRRVPWERRDAIPVAPGFSLVGRVTPGQKGDGFSRFSLVSRDGTRYPVHAQVSPAERWAVAQHFSWFLYDFGTPAPALSENARAWARTGDAVWLLTYGDGMGGLIRFDLRTRRYSVVLDTILNRFEVRAMAATRGTVWMAGEIYPPPVRESGVLGYDPAARTWTRYTTRNAPLPSDTVLALAAAGDTLWAATPEGLAMLDAATGRWDARWFRTVARVDTVEVSGMGYTDEEGQRRFLMDTVAVVVPHVELDTVRPPHEASQRLAVALAELLSPDPADRTMEPDSFFALVRRIPPAHFDSAAAGEHSLARALAHSEIAPLLFSDPAASSPPPEGIRALGLLGDRGYLPELRSLAGGYLLEDHRTELALALFRLGDTTLVPELRALVGSGRFGYNDLRYVEALAETGDTAAIPLIVEHVRRTGITTSYAALARLAPPARWREVVADAADDPRMKLVILSFVSLHMRADTVSDTAVRRSLARLARAVLETPAGTGPDARELRSAHYWAAELAADLRDLSLVPALIPLLTRDSTGYAPAMRALIVLTGVDSVPAPPRPSAAERAAARRFWTAWWESHRGDAPAVSRAEGLDALRRWRMRWELGRGR